MKSTLRWFPVALVALATTACSSGSGSVYNSPSGGVRTTSAPRKSG